MLDGAVAGFSFARCADLIKIIDGRSIIRDATESVEKGDFSQCSFDTLIETMNDWSSGLLSSAPGHKNGPTATTSRSISTNRDTIGMTYA